MPDADDPAGPRADRMLRISDVAVELNISERQAYALVRSGQLAAIRLGDRGQWRVEREALERWIQDAYEATRRYIAEHPVPAEEDTDDDEPAAGGTTRPAPAADDRPGQG